MLQIMLKELLLRPVSFETRAFSIHPFLKHCKYSSNTQPSYTDFNYLYNVISFIYLFFSFVFKLKFVRATTYILKTNLNVGRGFPVYNQGLLLTARNLTFLLKSFNGLTGKATMKCCNETFWFCKQKCSSQTFKLTTLVTLC